MASFTFDTAVAALAVDPIPVDTDDRALAYDAVTAKSMAVASNVPPSESMVTDRALELKRLTPLNSLVAVAVTKL